MHALTLPDRRTCAVVRTTCVALLFLLIGFQGLLLVKPAYPLSWYDHQRLMQLSGLTLSVVFLPFLPTSTPPRLYKALRLIGLVLLVAMCAHAPPSRQMVVEASILAVLVVVVIWWAGMIQIYELSPALLLSARLAIAGYLTVSLLWLWLLLGNGILPVPSDFFEGFINPRFFGAWVTLSWPLLLLRPRVLPGSGVLRERALPAALFVLAALWWSLAFFSGTRATWLAAVVTLVLTALCGPAARRIVRNGVVVIVAGYVMYHILFIWIPYWMTSREPSDVLGRLRDGFTLSNRDVLWRLAWRGIVERPWFGAGPMMFSATNNGVASTTHNIGLQLAYEWGIPFAMLVIVASVRGLWRQLLRCRREQDPIRLVLWMCVVGALIEAQFDSILSAPHSQLLFTVLCAWLVSLDEPATVAFTARPALVWKVLRFVPLALVLTAWWAVWPELSQLEAWEKESWQKTGAWQYQPRFWLQGVIFP